MNNLRIEYASSALKKPDYPKKIDLARRFCDSHGWTFGVQIHNSCTENQLQQLAAENLPLSFHAPTYNCDYFINLANTDFTFPADSIEKTQSIAKQYNPPLAVFHGFLMTDKPVLCFNNERGYDQCMSLAYRPELARTDKNLCTDFFDTDEFNQRLQRVKQRLHQINSPAAPFTWCIENDYPAYSAALLFAEHIAPLDASLCLDLSHLWIACLLFNKNFEQQTAALAQTGNIKCVHLHANPFPSGTPIDQLSDGHRRLSTPNQMNLPHICRLLHKNNISHWVIETPQADLPDLQTLADWLETT